MSGACPGARPYSKGWPEPNQFRRRRRVWCAIGGGAYTAGENETRTTFVIAFLVARVHFNRRLRVQNKEMWPWHVFYSSWHRQWAAAFLCVNGHAKRNVPAAQSHDLGWEAVLACLVLFCDTRSYKKGKHAAKTILMAVSFLFLHQCSFKASVCFKPSK